MIADAALPVNVMEELQRQDRLAWRRVYSPKVAEPIWHKVPFLKDWCDELRREGKLDVLDACCGDGGQMAGIPTDFRVTGLDQSPEAIDCARRHLRARERGHFELKIGQIDDAASMASAFPEPAAFDAVLFIDSLSMFLDPTELLAQMRRALRPDGRLMLCTFSERDSTAEWMRSIPGHRRGLFEGGFVNVLYTKEELGELLHDNGFEPVGEIAQRRDDDGAHPGFRGFTHYHDRLVTTCRMRA